MAPPAAAKPAATRPAAPAPTTATETPPGNWCRIHALTFNRVAVIVVVLVLVRAALTALMARSFLMLVACAVAAAAFACNWPLAVSRPVRILAFIVQVLAVVAMAGLIVMVLSIAEAGTTGWEEVPWWFWLLVAAVGSIVFKAVAAGYSLLNEHQ